MTKQTDNVWASVKAAVNSDGLPMRALRFGIVGILSSLVFAAVTVVCVSLFAIDHRLASAFGYLGSLPFNFIANRRFSFRSSNVLAGDTVRFLILHAGNLMVTTLAMGTVVDLLQLHYSVGILAAVILVPILNFVVMQWWVFRTR